MPDMIKNKVTKLAEAAGITWTTADDLACAAERIAREHPNAVIDVQVSAGCHNSPSVTELRLIVKMTDLRSDT